MKTTKGMGAIVMKEYVQENQRIKKLRLIKSIMIVMILLH